MIFASAVLEETGGRLCPTLDDAFIHYQYARSIVEGHPLAYHAGETATTGATSLLYIALLAVGWAVGFRGLATTWFAQGLAVVCLALAGWAAKRTGDALVGAPGGLVCAALTWAFPQLVFMALGGMELSLVLATQLLAIAASVRWCLSPPAQRTARRAIGIAAVGALAAAARPESITGAGVVAFALLAVGTERGWTRLLGAAAVAPGALPGLIARATTGQGRTNGQIVKWMYADPYLPVESAWELTEANAKELFTQLFTGENAFHAVPPYFQWMVALGLLVTLFGVLRRRGPRGAAAYLCFVGGLAGVLVPTTYWTFDTNFGRYLWPFVPIAAMAAGMGVVVLGQLAGRLRPSLRGAPYALAGAFVMLCVSQPERMLDTFVDSASEICTQHLTMVEHVRALPDGAVVAVSDAGALAYLTDHRTYDVIGLTTAGAARAWASGQGSVFEQLERIPSWRRPAYIAYYPRWLPFLPLGGDRVAEARVEGELNHVGAAVMELRAIDRALYGSGDRPVLSDPDGDLVDRLDVADLDSEREHAYALAMAQRSENRLMVSSVDGRPLADGGRLQRTDEQFVLRARPGEPATWIFRTDRRSACRVRFTWNGAPLEPVAVEPGEGWAEHVVAVPAERVESRNAITRRCPGDAGVGVYHDWLYQG